MYIQRGDAENVSIVHPPRAILGAVRGHIFTSTTTKPHSLHGQSLYSHKFELGQMFIQRGDADRAVVGKVFFLVDMMVAFHHSIDTLSTYTCKLL